jgi:hypothetical protein
VAGAVLALALGAVAASVLASREPAQSPQGAAQAAAAPPAVAPARAEYDPIALAAASVRVVKNHEAPIPAQCYTKTDGHSNPCWTCHTAPRFPNLAADFELQQEYAFSKVGETNHWTNLFEDRRERAAQLAEGDVLSYVRSDNYAPLRRALADHKDYPGYRPDLDFARGFDEEGFARDGSGWRAFRYKPFPGVFWPTNGNADDVMIRLPESFRSRTGKPSIAVYRANLAILEASFGSDPDIADAKLRWATEPLDEVAVDYDLNGDGKLEPSVHALSGLPAHYLGDAEDVKVRRTIFPQGVEFLHSVRYLDPDAPSMLAARMKELRYSRKAREMEDWAILRAYELEADEKAEGKLPVFAGSPLVGLQNDFGWSLQGFIEDAQGRLRLQTHEEHLACMGCHTNLGVTLDQTFAFARKVPGRAGWAYQDLKGMPDVPQLGHREPEFLTYLRRTEGGDEFRQNTEVLQKFFAQGKPNAALVKQSARGGPRDITDLIYPSRERALELNRAYMVLAGEQRFDRGRDVALAPAQNVHASIQNQATGLVESKRVYVDGQLRLAWGPEPQPLASRQ